MARHDIIVIGASAGGVRVLSQLARGLPPGLPASLFVTTHMPAMSTSLLPEILSRCGPLLARAARDGETIYPGHIYIAPPNYHLLLEDGKIRLSQGPRENHHRPAIDPMFRSAARWYGRRVVGVVLTGGLTDGVAGLMAVRAGGGVTVVQDPKDADVPDLPRIAHEIVGADHVVPADGLAKLLVDLVRQPVSTDGDPDMVDVDPLKKLPAIMDADAHAQERGDRRGAISVFTCPECGGALWQVDEKKLVRFRCHVGHSYVGELLLDEQAATLEAALWTAVRIFKEKTVLACEIAGQQRRGGQPESAERFEEDARLSEHYSTLIQDYLLNGGKVRKEPSGDAKFGSDSPETGETAEEMRNHNWCSLFVPEDDQDAAREMLFEVLTFGKSRDSTYDLVTKNRDQRTVLWSAKALASSSMGSAEAALLLVGHDITPSQQAQEQALQMERLAAIGQAMTGLTHESRNALQRGMACLEILKLRLKDRPEDLDLLARIQRAQDDLLRLYEEVRVYGAPLQVNRSWCDLAAVWREAWEQVTAQFPGKEAVLCEETAGVDLGCFADSVRLVQVFRNLLENAFAACAGPVRIVITCRETVRYERPALQITVQDNGPGLDDEQRRHIFEPFYTTKTKGTGLGTSIARRIVEAHGAEIVVGDCRQPGTVIVMTLPRS